MIMHTATWIDRIVQRIAGLVAPGHRDLVRGMLAELAAIPDGAERRRFQQGVLFTLARLAMRAQMAALLVDIGLLAPASSAVASGAGLMPPARQLLRRHVGPFLVSLGVLTLLLLANYASRVLPPLTARAGESRAMVEVIVFAIPFLTAMTLPMGVFLAVAWVFTRLGGDGTLAEASRTRGGMRRLLAPVVAASIGLSIVAAVSNTEVLPRTNHRLRLAMSYGADSTRTYKGSREMTVGELRAAATNARAMAHPRGRVEAAMYEVEIHKKYALAAASLVLALAAVAFGITFPHAGPWLVGASAVTVFVAYYACLAAGEQLVDQGTLPPALGMWMANTVLLVAAVSALRRRRSRSA